MRWKIPAALDILFSSLAAVTACALGNVLVAIHFPSTLQPHSNVVAHFMFRALITPKSLAEALIPPYWLPPVWWPLLIGLLGLVVAECILILLSLTLLFRVAVLSIAKSRKIDIDSAYREAQAIPDLARRFRLIRVRKVMLVSLPSKMIALFILGGMAGGIAWLISIFIDHFRSGVLQVFLACLVIAVGSFVFDAIEKAKNEVLGGDKALDILLELADVPKGDGSASQRHQGHPGRPWPDLVSRGKPQRLLVTSGGLAGTTIRLTDQQITIGRANDTTLVLGDDYVSSHHARLFPQDGQWIVEDLGSTNGTYLDRQKVTQPTPVSPGVPIRIGKTVLKLRI